MSSMEKGILDLRNDTINAILNEKEFNTRTKEELETYTNEELRDEQNYIYAIKNDNLTYEQTKMKAYGGPKKYAEMKIRVAEAERKKKEKAFEDAIPKIKTIIDKNVFESYMSKNYSKVKDPTTLKPGQVYYITTKNSEGIRTPVRYECPKTGPCNICEKYPNEVCELWKKTTLGSMFGESAEKKYEPYTLKQYKEYMDEGLIDNNGNHKRDGIYLASDIEIYNGRINPLGKRKSGGKTKRKHCKSKGKRKQCKSKRKGKGSKRHKTRRHSKK